MSTIALSRGRGISIMPLLILALLAIMVFVLATLPLPLPTTAAIVHTREGEVNVNGLVYQISITSTKGSCSGEIKNPQGRVIAGHTSQNGSCSPFTTMREIVREFYKQFSKINLSPKTIVELIGKWGELGALLP